MAEFDKHDAGNAISDLTDICDGREPYDPVCLAAQQAIALWNIADLLADIAAILDGMRDDALEARGKDRTDI